MATPMTEQECFLKAILENPGEDLHRLAFADWLQEHGEGLRAFLMRATWTARERRRQLDATIFSPDEVVAMVTSLDLMLEVKRDRNWNWYAPLLLGRTIGPVVGVDKFGAKWICPHVIVAEVESRHREVDVLYAVSVGTYTRIVTTPPQLTLQHP